MSKLATIINDLKVTKGLTDELIKIVIEDFLKVAFKKKFGTDENAVVVFSDDSSEVTLYAKKLIVDAVEDPNIEILLAEAERSMPDCGVGDQLLEEVNPEDFGRNEILVASQKAHALLQNFESDTIYSEFSNKEGEIVIGYFLREHNKNIIVDLGRSEGILPKKFQLPRDTFNVGDRIKSLVYEVKRKGSKVDIVLTRTHKEFVRKIFELEVPELYDRSVEIINIVREPGYRTKIAVRSSHSEIDPVGTCIGAKGSRINNVMLELDGERIDILKYDAEPLKYIYHSLSPAEVKQVIILDYAKRTALAVVEEDDFPIAIGKLGLNIRLASRLTNWQVSIKTVEQFKEMSMSEDFSKTLLENINDTEEVDISKVSELSSLHLHIINTLQDNKVFFIEDLLKLGENDFKKFGFSSADIQHINTVLKDFTESSDAGPVKQKSIDQIPTVYIAEKEEKVEKPSEEEAAEEDLLIDVLPLDPALIKKLELAGYTKLYDLVELIVQEKIKSIDTLTPEEQSTIDTIVKENVQVESEK